MLSAAKNNYVAGYEEAGLAPATEDINLFRKIVSQKVLDEFFKDCDKDPSIAGELQTFFDRWKPSSAVMAEFLSNDTNSSDCSIQISDQKHGLQTVPGAALFDVEKYHSTHRLNLQRRKALALDRRWWPAIPSPSALILGPMAPVRFSFASLSLCVIRAKPSTSCVPAVLLVAEL